MHANRNQPHAGPEIKGKWTKRHDIYGTLSRQHEEIAGMFEELFGRLASAQMPERRKFALRLAVELISHNEAESRTLYKRLRRFEHLRGDVERHQREHERTNARLMSLVDGSGDDAEWLQKFTEARAGVEEHVADEEGRLFPRAKKLLDTREAKVLAEQFTYLQDLRKNLMQPAT